MHVHLSKSCVRAAERRFVHQIMGSEVVTSAHLRFTLRIRISSFSTVGATCGRPKTYALRRTPRLQTVVIYVLSFHQERKNQRKCFLLARRNNLPWENGFPTLLSLEMRCSRTRCTCISQNPAFAPRNGVPCIKFAVLRFLC